MSVDLSWQSVVVAGVAAMVLLVVWGSLRSASSAVSVIVIALFLGMALDPLVNATSRLIHVGRGWTTVIILAMLLTVTGLFVAMAGPQLLSESANLEHQLPVTIRSFDDLPLIGEQISKLDLTSRLDDLLAALPDKIDHSGSAVGGVLKTASYDLGAILIGFMLVAGVLFEGPRMVNDVRRAIPLPQRPTADSIGRTVYAVLARYFAGSLLVALLNGIWVACFALVANVPLSPLLGVWSALTSLIPQLGGLLGFSLVFLVSLTAGVVPTIIMTLAFLAFMLFNNHVLNPTVVGHSVSLSAPVTMIAAIGGFSVAGIVGALLAVPTFGAIKSVYLTLQGHDVVNSTSSGPGFVTKARGVIDRLRHRSTKPGGTAEA